MSVFVGGGKRKRNKEKGPHTAALPTEQDDFAWMFEYLQIARGFNTLNAPEEGASSDNEALARVFVYMRIMQQMPLHKLGKSSGDGEDIMGPDVIYRHAECIAGLASRYTRDPVDRRALHLMTTNIPYHVIAAYMSALDRHRDYFDRMGDVLPLGFRANVSTVPGAWRGPDDDFIRRIVGLNQGSLPTTSTQWWMCVKRLAVNFSGSFYAQYVGGERNVLGAEYETGNPLLRLEVGAQLLADGLDLSVPARVAVYDEFGELVR